MTEQQEFLSFYMFETGPDLAHALDNFSFLKGFLADQIFSAIKAGNYKHIDSILNTIGVYLNVVDEVEAEALFLQSVHGYYISEGEDFVVLEMMGKRKPIFDGVCKAYRIDLQGMEWR